MPLIYFCIISLVYISAKFRQIIAASSKTFDFFGSWSTSCNYKRFNYALIIVEAIRQ